MNMKKIETTNAPGAIGPYSQAVKAGNLLFTSGQIAIDPSTNTFTAGTIESETERVCQNLKAILEAAGTDFDHVIKTTCFLSDMANFAAFNAVYGTYFTGKPARSCVAVKTLPKNVLCEIEAIGYKKEN